MRQALAAMMCVLLVAACWGSPVPSDACFDWPAGAACPGNDVAVLYLGGSLDECGQLVSIDAPGSHQGGQCCYAVRTRHDIACDFGH